MSPLKNMIIVLGVALVIASGGSAIVDTSERVMPIVIAREAEAVGRAFRVWKKRPMPSAALSIPASSVVASLSQR